MMKTRKKFFILVGIINKDLGPSLKKDAIKWAREEKKLVAKKCNKILLFQQTKHGAVSVSF